MIADEPISHRPAGRLSGRVVLVTGAGQGIGKTFALALATEGARVVLADIVDAAPVAEEIESSGGEALALKMDVTSAAAVASGVESAISRFGTIHALVNNAAMFTALTIKPFHQIESDEWDRVMAVNTRGPFECAKAVFPTMRAQGYGKIVNVASGTFFKGSPGLMHYVASKGAIVAMTRVMAREMGEYNICANALAPGFTESEMAGEHAKYSANTVASRCFKRVQTPDDLTGALLFLCSAESDFMTGQTVVVDGGSVFN